MKPEELSGIIEFLKQAEQFKNTLRSGHTSNGTRESAASHTWRLCLMALLLEKEFPEVTFSRLVKICIIHDLGEVIHGDIPAPEQAGMKDKSEAERQDLVTLLQPLPERLRAEILGLWDEYEEASTPEARLAKALDKLETILQHNQGKNPEDFDYSFNLEYGQQYTSFHPVIEALRKMLDRETEQRSGENIELQDGKDSDPDVSQKGIS